MQLNPQECSCCDRRSKQSGDFMLAGNPLGIQVPPHPPSPAEIYWSNKSSAIMEEN